MTAFWGSKRLDPTRPVPDFNKVATEVLQHLTSLTDSDVEVTVQVRATRREGFDEPTVRTVSENANYLGFEAGSGFSEV
jgi:uncharacterized protein